MRRNGRERIMKYNRLKALINPEKNSRLRSPPWHFDSYAPLSALRAQILIEIEGEGYLQKPDSLKAPPEKRVKQKYCYFHRDHGHDIKECR